MRDRLFSEVNLRSLVVRANEAIEREVARPPEDVTPLVTERAKLERQRARLVSLLADEGGDDLLAGLKEKLKAVQKRLNDVTQQLGAADARKRRSPARLTMSGVLAHVAALRDMLASDVPAAAEAIRSVTGKIAITQRKAAGRRGAAWVARFNPSTVALLDLPHGSAATDLNTQGVEIVVEAVPKAVQLSPKIASLLHECGTMSVSEIARRLRIPRLLGPSGAALCTNRGAACRPRGQQEGARSAPAGSGCVDRDGTGPTPAASTPGISVSMRKSYLARDTVGLQDVTVSFSHHCGTNWLTLP